MEKTGGKKQKKKYIGGEGGRFLLNFNVEEVNEGAMRKGKTTITED